MVVFKYLFILYTQEIKHLLQQNKINVTDRMPVVSGCQVSIQKSNEEKCAKKLFIDQFESKPKTTCYREYV